MKKSLILSLIAFSQFLAASAETKVDTETIEKNDMKLVLFKATNENSKDLYCRKISIPEVTYTESGEYIESLEAKSMNFVLDAKTTSNRVQDIDGFLKELFQISPDLSLDYDPASLVVDCELKNSRLNKLYIVDDRRSCGGGFEITTHVVDFGTESLKKSQNSIDISYGDSTNLYKNDYSNDFLKIEGNRLYRLSLDVNGVESLNLIDKLEPKKEKFAGSYWVNSNSFLVYIIIPGAMEVRKYSQQEDDTYKLEKTVTHQLFDYKKYYKQISEDNYEQLIYSFERNFKLFAGTFTLYHNYNRSHDILQIALTYRLPDYRMIYSKYNRSQNKWELPQISMGNFEASMKRKYVGLDFNLNEFKLDKAIPHNMRRFRHLIQNRGFTKSLSNMASLSFKNLKVQADGSKLSYDFGNGIKELDEFCNVRQVMSDRIMARPGVDLDTLFRGKTMLTKAAKDHLDEDYTKALDLLKNGAKVDMPDYHKNTPLHYSMGHEDLRFLKLFIANNANVNAQNKKGETPLHCEIEHRFGNVELFQGYRDVVKTKIIKATSITINILLDSGALTNIANNSGETVLDLLEKYQVPAELKRLFKVVSPE